MICGLRNCNFELWSDTRLDFLKNRFATKTLLARFQNEFFYFWVLLRNFNRKFKVWRNCRLIHYLFVCFCFVCFYFKIFGFVCNVCFLKTVHWIQNYHFWQVRFFHFNFKGVRKLHASFKSWKNNVFFIKY